MEPVVWDAQSKRPGVGSYVVLATQSTVHCVLAVLVEGEQVQRDQQVQVPW